ncbi:DUF4386 family protein [Cryobacterium sp. HLT2-28]|uniref:DUF4386 family protein n=1 Tax=Cryobacterium sp. HLT2-28 TaxID=1259146 RepID=UPI00141B2436|nr:DUF4386 family protein [Cryobacterium sp. HLT2-28]
MINARRIARRIGTLMLAAFLFYGIGSSLATTASPGALLTTGVAMMLLNSVAVGAIALLVGVSGANFLAYNIAMAGLGIGSLFFCVALYRSSLVPRFLAVWGFVGYASFAAGCFLELAGVAGAGLVSTVPGGLFEIFFAIWLIARGLGSTAAITVTARA